MKTKFTLIIVLFFIFELKAQCDFEQIINFTTGITKFQLSNKVFLNKNAVNFKFGVGYWDTPEYLKKDSIFSSSASFNYISSPCFGNNKNEVYMRFADDTLYQINLSIDFTPSDLDKCLQKYNEFVESAKQTHPIHSEYYQKNEDTNEQIGEGFWMYRNIFDKMSSKFKQLSIGYEIVHERLYSEYSKKWYYTGKIEKYVLKISCVDLTHTKYDRRGY